MFRGNNSAFDRLVDKATSQLLLEPDWEGILQICDAIRQNDVQPKYALSSIKKKIANENPHVALFALQVLESVMKNCGDGIHAEVASMEFMKFMKEEINSDQSGQDPVKKKALELIQVWSHAFRNEPRYKIVQDTYHWLKMEGYEFPVLKEADAMFSAEKAPDWKDGECCHRCRVGFSMMQRKHHCRACGEIFCQKCSSKSSIIPKYGIEREVRVCESCWASLNKGGAPEGKKGGEDELPPEYLASPLSQQSQAPPQRSEQEIQEEEELQLALALSKSEAEVKESEKNKHRSNYNSYSNSSSDNAVYATPNKVAAPVIDTTDMDPELARYLNRNYWDQKNEEVKVSTTQPSAPVAAAEPKGTTVKVQEKFQNGETEDEEQFLNALRGSIEIFVNRMKSNSQRGRSIANDSSVQSLFMAINKMHPKLMEHVSQQEDARAHYEMLQDKLAQLKDAREALDALREDHREKKRREMEELERQRQIQMAHKLEIMRQKKQEYLEYQRQLALQRMQEQEREMQMRLEQQKQMQQMRAMGYAYPPQMYQQGPPQGYNPAGYSPAGSVEGSPHHQPHPSGAGHYAPGPMGAPPGAPGAQMVPPPMGAQAAQPPGAAGGPPTSQPMYSQAQGQPQGAPPAVSYPGGHPGSYQPPGGAQGPYMPPPTSQAPNMGLPPRGYPNPSLDYQASGPPSMDYSSFNMQNMANALPAQAPGQMHMQGPPGGISQQQQQPPPPQHQQQPQQHYMPPPQGQYAPQGGPGMPPPGQHPGGVPPNQPPAGQHPGGAPPNQPPPGSNEAALISFD